MKDNITDITKHHSCISHSNSVATITIIIIHRVYMPDNIIVVRHTSCS